MCCCRTVATAGSNVSCQSSLSSLSHVLVVAYHIMTVYLQCLELLRTLIILSLNCPHSIKVLAFSLKITRATPRMSVCPHYRMAEP